MHRERGKIWKGLELCLNRGRERERDGCWPEEESLLSAYFREKEIFLLFLGFFPSLPPPPPLSSCFEWVGGVGVQYLGHLMCGFLTPSPTQSGNRTMLICPVTRTQPGQVAQQGHPAYARLGGWTRDADPPSKGGSCKYHNRQVIEDILIHELSMS
jgi:hypothetical protein